MLKLEARFNNEQSIHELLISYGKLSIGSFEFEINKGNIYQEMIEKWKTYDKNTEYYCNINADPILLLKIENDVGIFYRNIRDVRDICICNSSETPFSSLNIKIPIEDEEKFILNLEELSNNYKKIFSGIINN
uniref:Uncharacterized protein n=1 Tax=viral metagenome TaxID=1070528 RepID=A0A6C0ADZ3_9ZZZZ